MSELFKREFAWSCVTPRRPVRKGVFSICISFLFTVALSPVVYAAEYTLVGAIEKALAEDPWIQQSLHRQESLRALSIESGALPDPKLSLTVANLPTDTFDFDQEPMTQLKLGVSQMFSRGKTLAYQQERLENLEQMQPEVRADRNAKVAVAVSKLWLEAYRNELNIKLIEEDRQLFEYLVDVARSNYTSTSRGARQQDLVRAQLELTQLDDRLTRLHQQREANLARLGEWLDDWDVSLSYETREAQTVITSAAGTISTDQLNETLRVHPLIRSINWKLKAFGSEVQVAKQSYKPQWGINASYGYREGNTLQQERPDLFTVGVTFDIPVFQAKRQDKKLQSAQSEYEVVKTERTLRLRQLKAAYHASRVKHDRLLERQNLFDSRLLRQMAEQAEASLSAYTHDDGDFAEVVRARIAELNARVEALNVRVEIQKSLAELNYFLIGNTAEQKSHNAKTISSNSGVSYE